MLNMRIPSSFPLLTLYLFNAIYGKPGSWHAPYLNRYNLSGSSFTLIYQPLFWNWVIVAILHILFLPKIDSEYMSNNELNSRLYLLTWKPQIHLRLYVNLVLLMQPWWKVPLRNHVLIWNRYTNYSLPRLPIRPLFKHLEARFSRPLLPCP